MFLCFCYVLRVDVPVHMWDEEKKRTSTWDGALKPSKAVDELISAATKGIYLANSFLVIPSSNNRKCFLNKS